MAMKKIGYSKILLRWGWNYITLSLSTVFAQQRVNKDRRNSENSHINFILNISEKNGRKFDFGRAKVMCIYKNKIWLS